MWWDLISGFLFQLQGGILFQAKYLPQCHLPLINVFSYIRTKVGNVLFSKLNLLTPGDIFFIKNQSTCESGQHSPEFIQMEFDRDFPASDLMEVPASCPRVSVALD